MVEVLRRYSNQTSALADLRRATDRLTGPLAELVPDQGPSDLASASPVQGERLLTSRFTAEELTTIVERFQNGATPTQLAADYGIGLTSLKRYLRLHNSRRTDGFSKPR
jgi:hypothetical protein